MSDLSHASPLGERHPSAASTGIEREGELAQASAEIADVGQQAPQAVAPPDPAGVLSDLALLMRVMLRSRHGWPIIRLSVAICAVLIGNMVGQVRLNRWNGAFFDAIEKRNTDAFLHQLWVFLLIVSALLVLVVSQTWLQERFKIRRERTSHARSAEPLAEAEPRLPTQPRR